MERKVFTIILLLVSHLVVDAQGASAQFVRTNANNYFLNDDQGAFGFTQISEGQTKGLMLYYLNTPTPAEMWTPEKVSEAVFISSDSDGLRAKALVLPGSQPISIEGDFSLSLGESKSMMTVTISKEGYISVSLGEAVVALRGFSVIASATGAKARELLRPAPGASYTVRNGKLMFGDLAFDATKIGVIRERAVSPCEQGALLLTSVQYDKFVKHEPLDTVRTQLLQLQRGEISQSFSNFAPVFVTDNGSMIVINTQENGRLYSISKESDFEGVSVCVARDAKVN